VRAGLGSFFLLPRFWVSRFATRLFLCVPPFIFSFLLLVTIFGIFGISDECKCIHINTMQYVRKSHNDIIGSCILQKMQFYNKVVSKFVQQIF
jgi:hypothetical protein